LNPNVLKILVHVFCIWKTALLVPVSHIQTPTRVCCSTAVELYSAWTLATFTVTFIGCSQSV